MNKDRIH